MVLYVKIKHKKKKHTMWIVKANFGLYKEDWEIVEEREANKKPK